MSRGGQIQRARVGKPPGGLERTAATECAFTIVAFERRDEGALLAVARISVADLLELSVSVFAKQRGGILVSPIGGGERGPGPWLTPALIKPLREALRQRLALDQCDGEGEAIWAS